MVMLERSLKPYYRTTDIFFASALLSNGISLIGTELGDNPNYLVFAFDEEEKCKGLEKKWWAGLLFVSGLRYAEANKYLKRVLRKDKEELVRELG